MKKITQKYIDSMIRFLRKETFGRGFDRVVLGLSGGIDSAVVALLCKRAFCDFRLESRPCHKPSLALKAILMPSLTSSQSSIDDAILLCKQFEIDYEILDIKGFDRVFCEKYMIDELGQNLEQDKEFKVSNQLQNLNNNKDKILARGNFCARMRMATLYYISHKERRVVVGTSNKSELMLGYGTIFGDLACAINPIGGLFKSQIFELARKLKVPDSIISKPPSADLYAGQSDEGDLKYAYKDIDKFLESYEKCVEDSKDSKSRFSKYLKKRLKKSYGKKKEFLRDDILKKYLKKKFNKEMVENLYGRIKANAFKREGVMVFEA